MQGHCSSMNNGNRAPPLRVPPLHSGIPAFNPGPSVPPFNQRFNGPSPSSSRQTGWEYSFTGNAEVLRKTSSSSSNTSTPMAPPKQGNYFPKGNSSESTKTDHSSTDNTPPLDRCPPNACVLFLEPFCGGSHKQLLTTILSDTELLSPDDVAVFTLPGKKWHWRARTAALNFSQSIPSQHIFKVLFCSATLNLCELVGLRPDLAHLHKVIYFHENQLVYPVREVKERDFQYGYNQIASCLVANSVVFNSQYNLESFLREVPRHLNLQKDCRADTAAIAAAIRAKAKVLYFPVSMKLMVKPPKDAKEPPSYHLAASLHDKDPESFFAVLFQLAEAGHNFRVSVLGEKFSEVPPIFEEAKQRLHHYIVNWGYAPSKQKYYDILNTGDVVVSTAHHEFFGVAMLEAVGAGCFPLCPNRLVYPEIYPLECLYNTQKQLFKALANWCVRPQSLRHTQANINLSAFSWDKLRAQYAEVMGLPSP